jgi:AraC family transcriptional regulator
MPSAQSLAAAIPTSSRGDPIHVGRLLIGPSGEWSEPLPPEDAYYINVVLKPLPPVTMRLGARQVELGASDVGAVGIYDLRDPPSALVTDSMDFMRIHFTRRTLQEFAYDQEIGPLAGLRPALGVTDPVLYGLSQAMLGQLEFYGEGNSLFFDGWALAVHAHLARVYGDAPQFGRVRGGLAPWQFRRASELMCDKIVEGVTIAELASACGLSASHFSSAFRQYSGTPPHKWLMNKRIERAKALLMDRSLSLADIALSCGFVDQSHLTRVFVQFEGCPPARWRRLHFASPSA